MEIGNKTLIIILTQYLCIGIGAVPMCQIYILQNDEICHLNGIFKDMIYSTIEKRGQTDFVVHIHFDIHIWHGDGSCPIRISNPHFLFEAATNIDSLINCCRQYTK